MALPDICLARDGGGSGGVAGGAGGEGAASGSATGSGQNNSGFPFLYTTSGMRKSFTFGLYSTLCGKEPVDLTNAASVVFIAKEIMNSVEVYIQKQMTVVDAEGGLVSLEFTPDDARFAGVWPSAVVVLNSANEVTDEFRCYLYVQRSITDGRTINRPLTIPEVRMALRDVCPEYNTLLDDLEFSDAEIAYAMSRPIDEWNELSPCIDQYTFTHATFPWREPWLKATCSYLLQTAAFHYLRNDIRIAAGGVDVDDKAKHAGYTNFANMLKQEWHDWMTRKKRELNMGLCFGTLRSTSFSGRLWRRRM
jgi:hypothetical protein